MATAFAALDGDGVGAHLDGFLRMLERTHGGHADDAGIAQAAYHFLVRSPAIADGAQPVLDRQVQQLLGVGLEHVEVQAEGPVVRHPPDADDFVLDAVRGNGRTRQKAEASGIGGRGHQRGARHPAHRRLHDGVAAAQQIAQGRAQVKGRAHALPSFLLACTMDLASWPPSWPAPIAWLWAWAKWW